MGILIEREIGRERERERERDGCYSFTESLIWVCLSRDEAGGEREIGMGKICLIKERTGEREGEIISPTWNIHIERRGEREGCLSLEAGTHLFIAIKRQKSDHRISLKLEREKMHCQLFMILERERESSPL